MRVISFAITLLLCGSLTYAEPPRDLDDVLAPILAKHKTPALFAAIVDSGHVTALGAVGLRKIGSPEKVTTNDLIHLGSDTKAMTGLLIAKLIDKKQLTFDTPMDQIFPDIAGRMDKSMARITVRQLLDHTSGLPANVDWWSYAKANSSLTVQRSALLKDVFGVPPVSAPGTQYLYSNLGFTVLGAIVERKYQKPWEDVIRDELFVPLKMQSAGFGPPGPLGKVENPWGHTLVGTTVTPNQGDNAPLMDPAGRVHCTISDWARFAAQFLKTPADAPTLVPQQLRQELTTPPKSPAGSNYAGGWIITERTWAGNDKANVLTHVGSNGSWYAVIWLAPKKDFGVLAASNIGGDDAATACDEVSAALIGIHEAKP